MLSDDILKLEKLFILHGLMTDIPQSKYANYTISLETWERMGYVNLKYPNFTFTKAFSDHIFGNINHG